MILPVLYQWKMRDQAQLSSLPPRRLCQTAGKAAAMTSPRVGHESRAVSFLASGWHHLPSHSVAAVGCGPPGRGSAEAVGAGWRAARGRSGRVGGGPLPPPPGGPRCPWRAASSEASCRPPLQLPGYGPGHQADAAPQAPGCSREEMCAAGRGNGRGSGSPGPLTCRQRCCSTWM